MPLTKDEVTAATASRIADSKRAKADAYVAEKNANEIHAKYTFLKRHSGTEAVVHNRRVFWDCEANWTFVLGWTAEQDGDKKVTLLSLECALEDLGDRLAQPPNAGKPYEVQTSARLGQYVSPRKELIEEIRLPFSASEIRSMSPVQIRRIMAKGQNYTAELNRILSE